MRRIAACDPKLAWLASARPYDCRGSFVSLQLRAGATPLEVAQWAGHSPQVMFRHYAAVIEELVGEPRLSAEEQIDRARDALTTRPEDELAELVGELVEQPTGRRRAALAPRRIASSIARPISVRTRTSGGSSAGSRCMRISAAPAIGFSGLD